VKKRSATECLKWFGKWMLSTIFMTLRNHYFPYFLVSYNEKFRLYYAKVRAVKLSVL